MEIVIAILLLLILVALVSGNKDAASSVRKTIRIGLFLFLIGLAWLILIGYELFYFFSYTEKDWSNMIGLGFLILFPPFIAWANKAYLKELFSKDNKTIFKTLTYLLLGVIAWVTISIFYQEQKKSDPNLGWEILIIGFLVSGSVLVHRSLDKGWKGAFTLPLEPMEEVSNRYGKLMDKENARWAEIEKDWKGSEDELKPLLLEHYDKGDAIDYERFNEEQKVRGAKKKEDWWLYAFYYFTAFIFFGLLGYLWDFAFAWVMTLSFVKGNEWMAYGTLIAGGMVAFGLFASVMEELKKIFKKK